jgi:hypothetical protein
LRYVSSRFKTEQNNDNRNYLKYADITLTDGTVLNLTNTDFWSNGMKFEDSVSDDSAFTIGSANINTVNLSINNFDEKYTDYDFTNAEVICYVGLEVEPTSGTEKEIEKIRICTMTVVDTPYQDTTIIELTCEDNMRKFDRDYSESKLKYPATRRQIIQDACNVCGVTLDTLSFDQDSYQIVTRPDDDALTFRQVLAWVCQIGCQYARCDRYGRLTIKWYDTEIVDANRIEINSTSKFTPNLDDVVITGVRVTEYIEATSDDKTASSYLYGNEGYVLEISENKLIPQGTGETVAAMIGEKCVGMSFRPFETQCLTDISIEAGDAVLITDRKGNKYKSFLTNVVLQPGVFEQISCNAESAARNSSKQYSLITQTVVDARKSVQKEKAQRELALEEFEKRLDKSSGVFTTIETQEDGSKIFYLHDKPKLSESQGIWRMTAEAWGVSNDGGNTWNGGMTVDGDAIVRILEAVGVNANWINAGAITVKDAEGNLLFSVDMDTKSVYISGNVQIGGGKTFDDTLKEFAASAKNMTIQLSNEYQGIPVNSDGNYINFPECSTQVTVMYGAQDITENCSYTITESQNISGSWDEVEHTYTVESLTADSGWIDIRATYLENLSVSKRFTIAKQYAGEQGTAGRTYFINADADILLMGADKKITPNVLNLRPYYRDGQEDAKNFYAWWTIEKSVDNGSSWEDISTYSTSMKLIQIQLNALSLEAHDMIRASAYADKEKTILCDQQTFPVALDVSALSQKDIVEILSNNGAWKGLYYLNNELYVSFNAALGGILTLGGQNNGNGLLILLDDEGSEIGRMSSGGMSFRNSDNNIVIRINKSGMFFYDSTGQKRKVLTDSSGITMYTDYTDANNWKAIKIGKYGIYAAEKSGGAEDLWMEGDTSHQWDGYILRFLNGAVRLNANAVYTDGCSMGKNLTTSGTLSVSGDTGLKGDAYVAGNFSFRDYKEEEANTSTRRRPVSSASAALNRVAYLSSATRSNKAALTVSAQWGSSNYTTNTLYNDSASDIRLKENVLDCEINALDAVCKMPVCSFDWKETGVHQPLGLVADDIEKIDPLLALGGGENEDGSMNVKQIDRLLLTEYAIKAIQELSATVKEQSCKIRKLEGKLDGIKGN